MIDIMWGIIWFLAAIFIVLMFLSLFFGDNDGNNGVG